MKPYNPAHHPYTIPPTKRSPTMPTDQTPAAHDYPNLAAMTNGGVSGNLLEWPLLPVEAKKALAEIDACRRAVAVEMSESERAAVESLRHYSNEREDAVPPFTHEMQAVVALIYRIYPREGASRE